MSDLQSRANADLSGGQSVGLQTGRSFTGRPLERRVGPPIECLGYRCACAAIQGNAPLEAVYAYYATLDKHVPPFFDRFYSGPRNKKRWMKNAKRK